MNARATIKITLGQMRSHGVRTLLAYCGNAPRCHHHATMNAYAWPDEMSISHLETKFVCSKCGTVGVELRPDWGSVRASGVPDMRPKR